MTQLFYSLCAQRPLNQHIVKVTCTPLSTAATLFTVAKKVSIDQKTGQRNFVYLELGLSRGTELME